MTKDNGKPKVCLYCDGGATVRPIRGGSMYYCPGCQTYYSSCDAMREQLEQAARKLAKRKRDEFTR